MAFAQKELTRSGYISKQSSIKYELRIDPEDYCCKNGVLENDILETRGYEDGEILATVTVSSIQSEASQVYAS